MDQIRFPFYTIQIEESCNVEKFDRCLNNVILYKTNIAVFRSVNVGTSEVLAVSTSQDQLEIIRSEMGKSGFKVQIEPV